MEPSRRNYDFPVHPRNIPTEEFLRMHPQIGTFVRHHDDDSLWRVVGVYDASGRWLVNADGEEGQARTWDLVPTDDEF